MDLVRGNNGKRDTAVRCLNPMATQPEGIPMGFACDETMEGYAGTALSEQVHDKKKFQDFPHQAIYYSLPCRSDDIKDHVLQRTPNVKPLHHRKRNTWQVWRIINNLRKSGKNL